MYKNSEVFYVQGQHVWEDNVYSSVVAQYVTLSRLILKIFSRVLPTQFENSLSVPLNAWRTKCALTQTHRILMLQRLKQQTEVESIHHYQSIYKALTTI